MKAFKFFLPENFLAFYGFGFSSSKSAQSTTSSTTNQVTDQRAAASEGSIAAGAGATVNVTTADTDAIARLAEIQSATTSEGLDNTLKAVQNITGEAIGGNVDVTREALRTGSDQLATAADLGRRAIEAGVYQTGDALDFGERALQIATNAANQSQATTNDLIQRTNEQFTATLARNAGDAPQTVAQDAIKYGAIALGILGAALFFLRPQPKAV